MTLCQQTSRFASLIIIISSINCCSVTSEGSRSILFPLNTTRLAFKLSLILVYNVLEFGLHAKSNKISKLGKCCRSNFSLRLV